MTWLSNVLIEVLATIIYIFVLIPCWIVLHLCFYGFGSITATI